MTIEAIRSHRHEHANTSVASSIFNDLRSFCKAMRQHTERRRAERALWEMDPRLLKDIGIDRSEIMSVVYTGSRERSRSYGNF